MKINGFRMKIKGFPIHLVIYLPIAIPNFLVYYPLAGSFGHTGQSLPFRALAGSFRHTVRSVVPSSVAAFGVSVRSCLRVRPGSRSGPSFLLLSLRSVFRSVPACGFVRAHGSVRHSFFGRCVRCVGSSPLAGSSGHTVRSVIHSPVVAFGVSGRPCLRVRPGIHFGPSFLLRSSRSVCRVVPACGFVRARCSVRHSFFGRRVRCVGSPPLAGSSGHTVGSVIPSSVVAVGCRVAP